MPHKLSTVAGDTASTLCSMDVVWIWSTFAIAALSPPMQPIQPDFHIGIHRQPRVTHSCTYGDLVSIKHSTYIQALLPTELLSYVHLAQTRHVH